MPEQKKTSASKKPTPSTKPLWQKLFIKGGTVLLVNAPTGYAKLLHRDTLWKIGETFGFSGVSLVAVDDTWSAMRFKTA